MDTLLLLTSGLLVSLWLLMATFAMDVVRHVEGRRRTDHRLRLAPSAWQTVTA